MVEEEFAVRGFHLVYAIGDPARRIGVVHKPMCSSSHPSSAEDKFHSAPERGLFRRSSLIAFRQGLYIVVAPSRSGGSDR